MIAALAAQSTPEIAAQLLGETEDLLSDIAKQTNTDHRRLGRIYLRLAQVRDRLGMPTREISSAVRLARQFAERSVDQEALAYLDRLFPKERKR